MRLPDSNRTRTTWMRVWRLRRWALLLAAAPLFQTSGCYPDLLGGFNFTLQQLVNTTLITTLNTIVRNLLNL